MRSIVDDCQNLGPRFFAVYLVAFLGAWERGNIVDDAILTRKMSAVCGLRSAVCKCHTPLLERLNATIGIRGSALRWFALYLTIIPRARVGYEVMDSQRGA